MLIPAGQQLRPTSVTCSNRDLIRGFETIWNMKISSRQVRNLIRQLEKEHILNRRIYAWGFGKYGNQAQANTYEILNAEKGFADLFNPK